MSTHAQTLDLARQALRAGDDARASVLFEQVLASSPDDVDALHPLAFLALRRQDYATAAEYGRRAAAARPDQPAICSLLCAICRLGGKPDEAIDWGRRAAELAPQWAEAHDQLGAALLQAGLAEEAAQVFARSGVLKPSSSASYNCGVALLALQRWAEAAASFCQASEFDPANYEAHHNRAVALGKLGRQAEAAECFRHSIQQRPTFAAHYGLGRALLRLGDAAAAEQEFRRAVELESARADVRIGLGNVLNLTGRFDEARLQFEQALRIEPELALARQNLALLKLAHGDYPAGWKEYECRWQLPGATRPAFVQPAWEGEPLDGRTILLLCEQGIGDTIQLVRYAQLIKRHSPQSRVLLHAPRAWHSVLQTAPGLDGLADLDQPPPGFDYYQALFSLPRVLSTTLESLVAPPSYLAASRERIEHWRRALGPRKQFTVGIAWQGNPQYATDRFRSIPLPYFRPLAKCAGVRLVSLQKNYGHEQLTALDPPLEVLDLTDSLDAGGDAFVDTAAVMMNLDLVITSDTSIAHLAGALGVPAWVALQLAPNWRWLLVREDCPWYPSLRLFRQRRFDDWGEVFERLAGALQQAVSKRPR